MDKIERTFKIVGHKEDVDTVAKILGHMDYLGSIGASRNLLIRVDGDGSGRIRVFNPDGSRIDDDHYNIEEANGTIVCTVATYDIG